MDFSSLSPLFRTHSHRAWASGRGQYCGGDDGGWWGLTGCEDEGAGEQSGLHDDDCGSVWQLDGDWSDLGTDSKEEERLQ